MVKSISILLHFAAWIIAFCAGYLTFFWVQLMASAHRHAGVVDGMGAMGIGISCELIGGLSLILLVTCGILYFVKRERRDFWSLFLSGLAFVSMAGEVFVLTRMPHTGAC
jgi:hypothetical protein